MRQFPQVSRDVSRVCAAIAASVLVTAVVSPLTADAQSATGTRLLRSPSVSAQHVAFAYANNIWVVERAGGAARRLTSFQGQTQSPKLSPDGRQIAFSAEYAGNTDVYVVPVEGGQPTRLTWHPGADLVQGWTPDGKAVVFNSGRATWAANGVPRFWTVPVTGGVETAMPMPRANQGKISPDGGRVAYRMATSWDEERRNYRGGQNRPIWILDLKTMAVDTTPFAGSKEMDPAWVGDVVYFLSDRDGVSNVWSFDTRSRKLAQVTTFTDFDVKTLDAGAGVVVFEQAGYLHEYDPKTARARIIPITASGDFPWMMPQWKDVSARITNLALSATGKRAAVEARGEIFTIPAEKGDVRNLTHAGGSSEILPIWSPDGRSVAYFSDKSGEYRLVIAPQDGMGTPREIALPEPSRPYAPAWSPNGRKIAYQDTHFRIWVMDVASGVAKVADTDPYFMADRSIVPVWSPDSRWLAYPKRLKSLFRAIFVYDVEGGRVTQMTDGLADATSPAWDAGGKYLWFFASTNFALNSSLLDMSKYDRPETRALYLAILSKGEASPLLPESDDESGRVRGDSARTASDSSRAPASAALAAGATPSVPRPVVIEFDGMQQRIVAVTGVNERDYAQLRAGPAGTVFFVEPVPATGTAGGGAGGGTLHRFQLTARRASVFAQGVAQYVVSADGRKLLYRTGGAQGALYLVDADRTIPAAGAGRLNATLRAYIDPREEFTQIFNEGWRNQRNNLYVQNAHGSDWPAMKKMYAPLLPYVMHRADLNYLMDNMGAEIAIGHSYVRGGDLPDVPTNTGGLLGADFAVENGRYRVARIYDGESWNPELRAPLATPGVNVATGDYILAINGVELRAPDNLYRLLDGTANRQTVLTVNSRPDVQGARQVTVVPVANEQGLRTRAWVERNRRIVDSISRGTIAYVYLPNTGQPGYTSFNRYYFAQQDRQGVVVDERYNGGGSAADYIVDLLGRDYDGYFNNPVGERYPFTSPANGIWGPKVMIVNEMAGSGGDLMPFMFKRRKLGPLVGMRTWGGLVATTDTPPFVDGGSMIAPRFGFFSRDGKFAVENEGVAPDIEVENWPRDVVAGRDAQLERAVAEAMRLLKEKPGDRAKNEPAPPTWGKRGGR
ncbi:MAG: PDZ domain-containing protein [Gemmatimonadaceae bacterium]|nr:PDZ domain-containing protein [Gemmatimonadaceae bacterium]MCC6429887.1 PDZ domain-containing protein [Gemmatimonadaceae bacterium]